jgi:hypothetical protein
MSVAAACGAVCATTAKAPKRQKAAFGVAVFAN